MLGLAAAEVDVLVPYEEIPYEALKEPSAVANLNLNRQGNVIVARPGEKIFATLNFLYDADSLDPLSLNQIVIGYSEEGPQKCIFNELGYRCGEGIASFFLESPRNPGVYEIQCRFEQAYSPLEAMQRWWDEGPEVQGLKMTIGKIIVR